MVVVVIRDEVLDGVLREKVLVFGVKLGGEGFVVGHHQGWELQLLDDVGNGEGLAGAGCAEQHLVVVAFFDAGNQFLDGVRLIAGGFIGGVKFELHHLIIVQRKCFSQEY